MTLFLKSIGIVVVLGGLMKHCCVFEPFDTWVLKDNENFSQRKLSFGICPICCKPLAVLVQFDIKNTNFVSIKKIGVLAQKFVNSLKAVKNFALSDIRYKKNKSSTYHWVYGINKSSKNTLKQYAKDFYSNTVLVKKI